MIQAHIDACPGGEHTWHTGVYLQEPNGAGCNWNIEVNCNSNALTCGAIISPYIDLLRAKYTIPAYDPTAIPAYDRYLNARSVEQVHRSTADCA